MAEGDACNLTVLRAEIQHLRRELDLRDAAVAKALELQAAEIARRLADLNGEAGRLREMQAQFVPRETWEAAQREVRTVAEAALKLAGDVNANRSELEKLSNGLMWLTRLVTGALVTALIFAAVAAVVSSVTHPGLKP